MTTHEKDPYPEHTKAHRVIEASQAIGEFLDGSPYILAEYREVEGHSEQQLLPVHRSVQQVIVQWFDIDLKLLEVEKRAMLAGSLAAEPTTTQE